MQCDKLVAKSEYYIVDSGNDNDKKYWCEQYICWVIITCRFKLISTNDFLNKNYLIWFYLHLYKIWCN